MPANTIIICPSAVWTAVTPPTEFIAPNTQAETIINKTTSLVWDRMVSFVWDFQLNVTGLGEAVTNQK